MKLGIVGLPNVGKSTLFNALTSAGAQAANYPFCTIDPNVGVVAVPDKRLDVLAEMYTPEKITPATIEFVDIAGLVKGASKGEGLGNRFLAHIREVDAIVHVVRCFEDENIAHVDGGINPARDIETINLELVFADLEALEKRLDKAKKLGKGGDKQYKREAELCGLLIAQLEAGKPARSLELDEGDAKLVHSFGLITQKPVIYAANVSEDGIETENDYVQQVRQIARAEGSEVIVVCAQMEQELSELDPDERRAFLEDLGLSESGLDKLVSSSYALLGLISYLTAGPQEVRAWTIELGTKAPQAAGKIHTDFERGFIRAEVVPYKTLVECGSIAAAKDKGLYRSEGKEYVIENGDVVLFRFNV